MWNLHESIFIIFFHHCEEKWSGENLPDWSLKSYGCLLTNGLPITSKMYRILRIWPSSFKYNYLQNKKSFLSFLFHLWNLYQISNISKQKKIVIANLFRNQQLSKSWLDHSLKSALSGHPSTVNMLKGP